jgi:hypothetical protein
MRRREKGQSKMPDIGQRLQDGSGSRSVNKDIEMICDFYSITGYGKSISL